jgi:hypothetical protein
LPAQLRMLDDEWHHPAGLRYQPDFVSPEEEAALIGHIRALPLAPFQFGAFEGKRRVVSFGSRYDYTAQRLAGADPLPDWTTPFAARIERFAVLAPGSIVRHRHRHRLAPGQVPLRSGVRPIAGIGVQVPLPPEERHPVGAPYPRCAAPFSVCDDRRSTPCVGAQHPAGRDAALLDHLPHDGCLAGRGLIGEQP